MGEQVGGHEVVDEPGPVVREPQGPVFVRRASNVLALAAILTLVAFLLLAGPGTAQVARPELLAAIVGVLASGGLFAWLSIALDRGRAWAPGAAALVLWMAVLTGAAQLVIALLGGQVLVPLDALIAGWALSSPDRPAARLRGAPLLVLVLVVAAVAGRLGGPVLGLYRTNATAHAQDLRLSISVDCMAVARDRSAPLVAHVAWAWKVREPITPAQDAIEIAWVDDIGNRLTPASWAAPAWLVEDEPGIAMQALEDQAASIPVRRYGFDPALHPDGQIDVPFEVEGPAPIVVSVAARYAHGGAWTRAETMTCDLSDAAG